MDKVSKQFEAKYKHLFVEKSTIFNPMKNEIPSDYEVIAFPKDYPIRKRISDMRLNYKEKEVKLKRGRKKIGKEKDSKTNADIVLENSSEELMRRLFNTLSIAKSQPKIRNLDIHFQVRKRIFKESIPTIEKLKSASGLIKGARVRTTRQKYDAKIRATQRDRRWAKILLINLCNGVFPKIDKVIL